MEKQQFVDLLGRFSQSSENEALNIMSLKEYFPYSQVLHALSARSTKAHRFQEQQSALQLAAVYAADRAVLKQVMTDDVLPAGKSLPPYIVAARAEYAVSERPIIAEEMPAAVETAPFQVEEQDITTPRQSDAGSLSFQNRTPQASPEAIAAPDAAIASDLSADISIDPVSHPVEEPGVDTLLTTSARPDADATETPGDTVADRVINDLEKLNQLKHNFEALFEANKASILLRDAALTVGAAPVEDLNRVQQARQQRIAALVSSLDPELSGDGELDYGAGSKNFLEEIKNNKEALEPVDEKQKDQLRMIDDFINIQPNMTGKDKGSSEPEDLTTIKTGEFSDNIVSETLVDILIKQGKKDKAIEVLKKLIWKFPQKKAYFAAQIEDLKK